jgi:hypothetical protein
MGTAERLYPRRQRKQYSCGPERFSSDDWRDWLEFGI